MQPTAFPFSTARREEERGTITSWDSKPHPGLRPGRACLQPLRGGMNRGSLRVYLAASTNLCYHSRELQMKGNTQEEVWFTFPALNFVLSKAWRFKVLLKFQSTVTPSVRKAWGSNAPFWETQLGRLRP